MAASNSAAFSFVLTVAATPPFQFKSFFNAQHRRSAPYEFPSLISEQ